MSILLVLTPIGAFIDPFSVIFGQSVEVDPEGSRLISYDSLWSFDVDRYFVLGILNKGKSSGRVAVPVKVIELILREKCLVVFMLEQLSFDSQPAIRICDELI